MQGMKIVKIIKENLQESSDVMKLKNGFEITGPSSNKREAEKLVKSINKDMEAEYDENLTPGGDNFEEAEEVMDEVFWRYEDDLKEIGWWMTPETEKHYG